MKIRQKIILLILASLLSFISFGCSKATLTNDFDIGSISEIEAASGIKQAKDMKDPKNLAEIDNDRSYDPHANDADNWRAGAHYGYWGPGWYGYGWRRGYHHHHGYHR